MAEIKQIKAKEQMKNINSFTQDKTRNLDSERDENNDEKTSKTNHVGSLNTSENRGRVDSRVSEQISKEKSPKGEKLGSTKNNKKPGNIISIIRIKGCVKLRENFENTLSRLRLKRKYACVLINSSDKNLMGMLKKIRNYVAYGEISDETLAHLIKERGKSIEGNKREIKINAEEVVKGMKTGKKLSDFGLKNFFRLHPPRCGINSKLQYPKGVLGNHRENINKLVERMM